MDNTETQVINIMDCPSPDASKAAGPTDCLDASPPSVTALRQQYQQPRELPGSETLTRLPIEPAAESVEPLATPLAASASNETRDFPAEASLADEADTGVEAGPACSMRHMPHMSTLIRPYNLHHALHTSFHYAC